MPVLPGKLDKRVTLHAHPYTYYSDQVRKVMDATGIVHETRKAGPSAQGYARCTRCESTQWHLVEPLNTVDENTVTTCLECVGAGDGEG